MDKVETIEGKISAILDAKFDENSAGIVQLGIREGDLNIPKNEALMLMNEIEKKQAELATRDLGMDEKARLFAEYSEQYRRLNACVDRVYDEISGIASTRVQKTNLYYTLAVSRDDLLDAINDNNEQIADNEEEIVKYNAIKANSTATEVINLCDISIMRLQNENKRLKAQNNRNNKKIQNYEEKREILFNGGTFGNVETNKNTQEETNNEPNKKENGTGEVNDLDDIPHEPTRNTQEETNSETNEKDDAQTALGGIPPAPSRNTSTESLPEEGEAESKEKENTQTGLGIISPAPGQNNDAEDLPDEVEAEIDNQNEELPDEVDTTINGENEEEEEEDEEMLGVVEEAKPGLLRRAWDFIKTHAKEFLAGIIAIASVGTAIHTGLMVNTHEYEDNQSEEEEEEELENEENTNEEIPSEEVPDEVDTPTEPTPSNPTPSNPPTEPTPTNPTPSNPTPSNPPVEPTPSPTPTDPINPPIDPTPTDPVNPPVEQDEEITLGQGESYVEFTVDGNGNVNPTQEITNGGSVYGNVDGELTDVGDVTLPTDTSNPDLSIVTEEAQEEADTLVQGAQSASDNAPDLSTIPDASELEGNEAIEFEDALNEILNNQETDSWQKNLLP